MKKNIIITDSKEKALNFVKALMPQNIIPIDETYYENQDYIVIWTNGPLFEYAPIDELVQSVEAGDVAVKLIFPETIKYKIIQGKENIAKTAMYLFSRSDVGKIITATELEPRGDNIVTSLFAACGIDPYKENIFRYSSIKPLTKMHIWEGLNILDVNIKYKKQHDAEKARSVAEWLYQINISRAIGIRLNIRWRLGRVHAYVLKMIVDRQIAKENYQETNYWTVSTYILINSGRTLKVVWVDENGDKKVPLISDAENIIKKVKNCNATVIGKKIKNKVQTQPKLYNLTELQKEASSKYQMTADQVIKAATNCFQKHQCITSPKTLSNQLPDTELPIIKDIIYKLTKEYPDIFKEIDSNRISLKNTTVFSRKIKRDRSAIIPIAPLTKSATENERNVYGLILKRFSAAFSKPCEYQLIEFEFMIGEKHFSKEIKITTIPGWKEIYGQTSEEAGDSELSELEIGDTCRVIDAEIKKSHTKAPAEYTESAIIRRLESPAKNSLSLRNDTLTAQPQELKIGTQHLRNMVVRNLIDEGYVIRQKTKLSPTRKGQYLIDVISRLPENSELITLEEAIEWEKKIIGILRGLVTKDDYIENVKARITNAMREFEYNAFSALMSKKLNSVCPECGGLILERQKFYGCDNWKEPDCCKFKIWKYFYGKILKKADVEKLLSARRTHKIEGFVSKKNRKREFSAQLKLQRQVNGSWCIQFDFNTEEPGGNVGKCPDCDGNVYEYERYYACLEKNCSFKIWKKIKERIIELNEVEELLKNGKTEKLFGFVNKNIAPWKKYSASLVLAQGNPSRVSIQI